jgi:hypothetical protein
MTVKEFLMKKEKTFWETRNEDLEELAARYDSIYSQEWGNIEAKFKQDFFEWVTMDHDFEQFNEDQKEEILESLHMTEPYVIDKVTNLL